MNELKEYIKNKPNKHIGICAREFEYKKYGMNLCVREGGEVEILDKVSDGRYLVNYQGDILFFTKDDFSKVMEGEWYKCILNVIM